uniref:Putative ovule protein n=1 Tax=Solanum chacoense TaxID=4108 RepID=A0A0V0GR40_SOLCH
MRRGNLHGREIIDSINVSIETSKSQTDVVQDKDDISPFKHITRKLQMKKRAISKSELLASYMEEVKKDLVKNMGIEFSDSISMVTSNEEEDNCLA